jgi:hypothetical protein
MLTSWPKLHRDRVDASWSALVTAAAYSAGNRTLPRVYHAYDAR